MTTIVVVGSVNVDLVAVGARIPAPGETVTMDRFTEVQGGKGANQAASAAALGARVRLVGATGADQRGDDARAALVALGVELDGLARVDEPTGVALIFVDGPGENSIGIVPGANGIVSAAAVVTALDRIEDDDVIVVTCLEIPLAAVQAAADAADRRGWRFVLNPAPARPLPDTLVVRCDVITPNASELDLVGGVEGLLARGARAVVVTRGSAGSELHRVNEAPLHFPAVRAAVVDTTGAGDAFTAGLAVALSRHQGMPAAVAWANGVAAIATEGFGARGSLATSEQASARVYPNSDR